MDFNDLAFGFVYTKTLHWDYYDATGYVGYLDSEKTINVVMRGTKSAENKLMNADTALTDYTTWPECNCKVHRGVDTGVNGVYP